MCRHLGVTPCPRIASRCNVTGWTAAAPRRLVVFPSTAGPRYSSNVELMALVPPLAAGCIAALITNLVVPVVTRIARATRAMDYPGGRKDHHGAIPRMGGIAIAAGISVGAGVVALIYWDGHGAAVEFPELIAMVLGTALVFLVGTIDDVIGVSPLKRFLVEAVAAWIVVSAGWSFDSVGLPLVGPLELGSFGPVVSILWIVGVTNAINLLDGLDGLAGGVVLIISASFMAYSAIQGNYFTTLLMAAIVGSCMGFLRHNWAPAKIFMGDGGSLTLGFLLGSITVHASLKATGAVAILVPILALGVPVIDTLLVMVMRFLQSRRRGPVERVLRVFRGDRQHLHHLLEPLTRRRRAVVRWVYAMVLVSCSMALMVALTKSSEFGWLLVLIELVAIAIVRQLGWARNAREVTARERRKIREQLAATAPE